MAALEEHRATWQYWHLWAEIQRQLRGTATDPADTAAWPRRWWRRQSTDPSGLRRSMTRPVYRTSCAGPTVGRCRRQ